MKKEKGSVTLFVLIACMFMIVILENRRNSKTV